MHISQNSNDSIAYLWKGNCYIYDIGISLDDLKRYEESIQMYDKAIQLNPQYSEFYNNKGLKYIYNIGNSL